MVNYSDRLDQIFGALVSPARRAILQRLAQADCASISELALPICMSLPAVMKHLDVLEDARLITRAKTGRTMLVRLSAKPMAEAMAWLHRYEKFWSASLDRLTVYAEMQEAQARKTSPRKKRR
jgi:DNA-binding transcriptional ArsR family regulator